MNSQTKVLMQITGKASIKSGKEEIAFIQNHPNGQKMITKCKLVQTKHFRVHIKQYSLSRSYYQTVVNTFESFSGHLNRQKILKEKIPK